MNPAPADAAISADGAAFVQDAHLVTRPDGSSVIAKSGAAAYTGCTGYTVTPVRGYDDPSGRGFRITSRGAELPGSARSQAGGAVGEDR